MTSSTERLRAKVQRAFRTSSTGGMLRAIVGAERMRGSSRMRKGTSRQSALEENSERVDLWWKGDGG